MRILWLMKMMWTKNISFSVLMVIVSIAHALASDGIPTVNCAFQNGYWVVTVTATNRDAMDAMKARDPDLNPTELGQDGMVNELAKLVYEEVSLIRDSVELELMVAFVELNSLHGKVQLISERMERSGCEIQITCTAYELRQEPVTKAILHTGDVKDVRLLNPEIEWVTTFDLEQLLAAPCQ